MRFEVSPGKQFETLAPKYPTQKRLVVWFKWESTGIA